MTLRPASPTDAPRLAAIDACWDTTPRWTEEQFRKEASDTKAVAFVAEAGGTVAGFAAGWVVGEELQIFDVAVDPAFTRRGIGRALLSAALAEGARRGATSAHLEVAEGNAPAAALYTGAGFKVVARRPKFYGGRTDALAMSRPLP